MRTSMRQDKNLKRSGFSLTELVIVLGVFGTILAGVWGAVQLGWENAKRTQANQQITVVVSNMRGFFGGQLGVWNLGYGALVPSLLNNGVIPGTLQRASTTGCTNTSNLCADNPWGPNSGNAQDLASGTFRVCNWSSSVCASSPPGSTSPTFGIMLTGLSQSSCIALATRVTATTGPTGLVDVNINSNTAPAFVALGLQIQPVLVSTANSKCNVAGNGNTIVFAYKVVSP